MSLYGNGIYPVGGVPSGATGGGIIQVVQTLKTTATTFASATYADVSGMSVTITPRTSSNKVMIVIHFSCVMNSWYGDYGYFRILRGATAIGADPFGVHRNYNSGTGDNYADYEYFTFVYVDSPATTAATTYKLQAYNANTRSMWFNRDYNVATDRNCSSITAYEIAG
jgi:hypothetical protein